METAERTLAWYADRGDESLPFVSGSGGNGGGGLGAPTVLADIGIPNGGVYPPRDRLPPALRRLPLDSVERVGSG